MFSLLDNCLDQIDIEEFFAALLRGLSDHSDVKILCFEMMRRLCRVKPVDVYNSELTN